MRLRSACLDVDGPEASAAEPGFGAAPASSAARVAALAGDVEGLVVVHVEGSVSLLPFGAVLRGPKNVAPERVEVLHLRDEVTAGGFGEGSTDRRVGGRVRVDGGNCQAPELALAGSRSVLDHGDDVPTLEVGSKQERILTAISDSVFCMLAGP